MHQNFKILIVIIMLSSLHIFNVDAQQIEQEELVQYTKTSNFIKEFKIPLDTLGLKGITTDSQGNAWFYHATNVTSTIIKFEPETGIFTTFSIEDQTQSNDPIINLAGGMIMYDKSRDLIWFTDARTNSIVNIDIQSGKVQLVSIPMKDSGPMGIALSPDEKSIWFSEIIANKIAKLDVQTGTITEYSTGEQSGPTFLTFDNNGELWITLSYSHEILHVKPKLLDSDLTLVEYEIPSRPADGSIVYPLGISVDSQNNVWFSEWNVNKIGIIDGNKPIPFDIIVNSTKITIPSNSNENPTLIEITVLKEDDSPLNVNETNTIFLKTSSTMDPSLGLVNITATFTNEMIFLNETTKSESVQLLINSNFPPSGNYTLAISATNGEVTKSVFLDLIID